ncbi:unnamed protein product [Closterium sp. Naga37s-1]|nr:unnamed protein product [Closterium sp. Naga37s-1]
MSPIRPHLFVLRSNRKCRSSPTTTKCPPTHVPPYPPPSNIHGGLLSRSRALFVSAGRINDELGGVLTGKLRGEGLVRANRQALVYLLAMRASHPMRPSHASALALAAFGPLRQGLGLNRCRQLTSHAMLALADRAAATAVMASKHVFS